jgi:ribonuclease T2
VIRSALAAVALFAPAAASAQALSCTVPARVPTPRPDTASPSQPRRVVPIGGYTLALTWSPQFCRERGRDGSTGFQCGSGNRFGFTLHGLWPDGRGRAWPQYCRPAPLLSVEEVRRNLCATPSVQLLQHEYAKHGTCMGVPPSAYFSRARALFERVRVPDMDALSRREGLSARVFAAAFARANPGMTPDMMRITATRGDWLDELWLCLDTRFRPARCPRAPAQPAAGDSAAHLARRFLGARRRRGSRRACGSDRTRRGSPPPSPPIARVVR